MKRDEITNVLRQRLVAGLHLGLLKPGQRLGSVRTLAIEFESDRRVVLSAYRQLESEGLVELRPRSGVFVADSAVAAGEVLPQTAEWVVEVLVQALGRGVPAVDFPERVRGCLQTVQLRAACIECNDDQISGLCTELGGDYGMLTQPVDLRDVRSSIGPEELEDVDLLVTTGYHATEVQQLAERLGKPWLSIALRPEFVNEATRLLAEGPLYFVGTDERFAEKLSTMFKEAPGAENLRVLIVEVDDLSRIPADAPTYVMPRAREQLDDAPLLARVIPAPRVFSAESARSLLQFIVRANIAAIQEAEAADGAPVSGA